MMNLPGFCFPVTKNGDITLLLYDATTLYLEATKENEAADSNVGLRRVGYSKEKRVDRQIVVGLLMGWNGFPPGSLMLGRQQSGNHDPTTCDSALPKPPLGSRFRRGS